MASSRDKAGLPYLEPLICILERSKDEDVIGVLHRIYEYVTYFEGNERLRGNRLPTHDEKPVEKEHLYTPFSELSCIISGFFVSNYYIRR